MAAPLLVKGRRILEGEHQGQHLIGGYLFGDLDYADGQWLRFLRTTEAASGNCSVNPQTIGDL